MNGDTLRVSLNGLDGKVVYLDPQVAPGSVLAIDVDRIIEVAWRESPPAAESDGRAILRTVDDSLLKGSFSRLTPDALEFDVDGVGRLAFPQSSLLELTRNPSIGRNPKWPSGMDAVVAAAGAVYLGDLGQAEDGRLVIIGDGAESKVPYETVAGIFFGQAEPAQATTPSATEVLMRNGSRFLVSDVGLRDGMLYVTLLQGQQVRVALAEVQKLAFHVEPRTVAGKSVLAWGFFSDRKEEFAHTVQVLRKGLGRDWKVEEDFSERFDQEGRVPESVDFPWRASHRTG